MTSLSNKTSTICQYMNYEPTTSSFCKYTPAKNRKLQNQVHLIIQFFFPNDGHYYFSLLHNMIFSKNHKKEEKILQNT